MKNRSITKSQVVDTVADRLLPTSEWSHQTKHQVAEAIGAVFDAITEALRRDDRIEIRGFGSFTVKHRQGRQGRNPKTGEAVHVPEKRIPFFTVGKELRDRVNSGRGEGVVGDDDNDVDDDADDQDEADDDTQSA